MKQIYENSAKENEVRIIAYAGAVLLTIAVLVIFNTMSFPPDLVRCLVDKSDTVNYFAVQNIMWLAFFTGLAELLVRFIVGQRKEQELTMKFLPERDEDLIVLEDMPKLYSRALNNSLNGDLSHMVLLLAAQYQTGKSTSMCNEMLNSFSELRLHAIDLKYNMVRYISWLIPSLGFIGTVWGILLALKTAASKDPTDPGLLPAVVGDLSVAFFTTLLALIMSCLLMFVSHICQAREERVLNASNQYCLVNFINRLFSAHV